MPVTDNSLEEKEETRVFPPKTHIAYSFVVAKPYKKKYYSTSLRRLCSYSNTISKVFVFNLHPSQKPAGFFVYIYFKTTSSVSTLYKGLLKS